MRPIDACFVHADPILRHYNDAREKHPYFCDMLLLESEPSLAAGGLRVARARLNVAIKSNSVSAIDDLLDCKAREFIDAFLNGDNAQAVEKLYGCAVICLRAIDVIEGRQKLGKQEEAK